MGCCGFKVAIRIVIEATVRGDNAKSQATRMDHLPNLACTSHWFISLFLFI